ncbi:cell division protein ZapA [Leptospira ognonensis]|uniref:Cell division protein ZapA n=1 Tax=Leptospira ognonensis TaxID=2484945 RepID=A0A4R9JZ17_9LEPT|nr:cell division protein ZapA [Leptospira ognonensis]TGL57964.1 cell division protein ZapA [Leptospira ognonensis]
MADSAPTPQKITKQIFGESYTIVGEASATYINSIAEYVEERLKEVSSSLPNASKTKVAVLCALNLADELFQLKEKSLEPAVTKEIEDRTKKIISLLEEGIIGDIY